MLPTAGPEHDDIVAAGPCHPSSRTNQASSEAYNDTLLPNGNPSGTPQQALDCALGLYLADPSAWLNPEGSMRCSTIMEKMSDSGVCSHAVDHWLAIEIFDGKFPASSWRRAHGDNLTEAAVTNGVLRWEWHPLPMSGTGARPEPHEKQLVQLA